MRTIIIDDEKSAIETLAKKLKSYDDVQITGTATTGRQGIQMVKEQHPELLFLDVELPDITGINFLEQMERMVKTPCKVIIYTAHSNYMLPAFRNKAFDFLLKPVDDHELKAIMQRYYIEQGVIGNESAGIENGKMLLYTNATDFRVVNIQDVGLFQYNHEQRVWEAIAASQTEPIRLKRSANNEALLAIDPRFVQISQRFIININYLMEVNNNYCRFFPPFQHVQHVSIGRTFRKKLIECFNTF